MRDSPKNDSTSVRSSRRRLGCLSVADEVYIGILLMVVILGVPPALCRILLYNDTMLRGLGSVTVWVCIGVVLFFTAISFSTLLLVVLLDPGFVSPTKASEHPYCHRCPLCNEFVKEYDHHCSALGACIGKYNMPYFIVFLFSTLILSICGITIPVLYTVYRLRYLGITSVFRESFTRGLKTLIMRWILTLAGLSSVVSLIVCFHVFLFVGAMFGLHFYQTLTGKNALERRRLSRHARSKNYFYNLSVVFRGMCRVPRFAHWRTERNDEQVELTGEVIETNANDDEAHTRGTV